MEKDYEDWAQEVKSSLTFTIAREYGLDIPIEVHLENGEGWRDKGNGIRTSSSFGSVKVYVGMQTDLEESQFYKQVIYNLAEEIDENSTYDLDEKDILALSEDIHPEYDLAISIWEKARRTVEEKFQEI